MEEKKRGDYKKWNLEKVLQLFEEQEIRNVTHLNKISSGAVAWCYKNKVIDQLPFTNKRHQRDTEHHQWHDINKVMHYLERWAREEGTTVYEQAKRYGYGIEYKEKILNEEKQRREVATEPDLPEQLPSE